MIDKHAHRIIQQRRIVQCRNCTAEHPNAQLSDLVHAKQDARRMSFIAWVTSILL